MKWFFAAGLICSLLGGSFAYADDVHARAQKVYAVPANMQVRIEWSGANPIYIGYADKGLSTNQSGWFIMKLTWSGANVTLIQTITSGVWDNRASLIYS